MYSKGISWIDDCRIPFVDDKDGYSDEQWKNLYAGDRKNSITNLGNEIKNIVRELLPKAPQGRFPANILVSDDMLNDGVVSKSIKGGKGKALPNSDGKNDGKRMRPQTIKERGGFDDKGTNSRYYDIDKWFDKILDV